MPLIRVNLQDTGLALHDSPAPALPALRRAAMRGDGPVIVMVHGFKFRPGDGLDCPHEHIFSFGGHPCRKAKSWPKGLGIGAEQDTLGVAYGWNAKGMIWTAYAQAAEAGAGLARTIRELRRAAPHRPVHAIAHSLGARVVLQALRHLEPGDVTRVISLNGAEFRGAAQEALGAPAGRTAELIAVTARENAGVDLLFERLVAPAQRGDRAMGWGLAEAPGRVMLRLDRAGVSAHLARLGFPLAPHRRLFCHWSPYLREGTMALYAALMRQPDRLPLEALRIAEPDGDRVAMPSLPLPMGSNAPS
ncbi:DUF726 domain-containing protein [Rhodobacteraceae bacterium D3-12]|nr:DUF726 domain-containing protein [Rhodobacteraceae bacterium D3-12]